MNKNIQGSILANSSDPNHSSSGNQATNSASNIAGQYLGEVSTKGSLSQSSLRGLHKVGVLNDSSIDFQRSTSLQSYSNHHQTTGGIVTKIEMEEENKSGQVQSSKGPLRQNSQQMKEIKDPLQTRDNEGIPLHIKVEHDSHTEVGGGIKIEDQWNRSKGDVSANNNNTTPVVNRIDAQDVIVNFKKHLLEKWKKNKAKQHVNKIIHYHVQHTFFLRYAAPLFLKDYSELLSTNLAREGGNGNNREQGLIATLKQINCDILNNSKKTKSVDVLESYLTKLEQKEQLDTFLDVLVYILFGETPHQIPSELNERKKNLFHYVSPIIAFLIIFYIHADKKPLTLDELVTRSGLKQLYKNVKVPCKEGVLGETDDQRSAHANDSDSEDDDEMIDEGVESPQQTSPSINQSILTKQQSQVQPTKQMPSASLPLKKKNSSHPLVQNDIKEEDIDNHLVSEDKRTTPQFQDLEKTLMQQKQQQQQQQLSSGLASNLYNRSANLKPTANNISLNNGALPPTQSSASSSSINNIIPLPQTQLSMSNMHIKNQFINKNSLQDNDEYDEDITQHDQSTNQMTYINQDTPPSECMEQEYPTAYKNQSHSSKISESLINANNINPYKSTSYTSSYNKQTDNLSQGRNNANLGGTAQNYASSTQLKQIQHNQTSFPPRNSDHAFNAVQPLQNSHCR